MARRRWRSTTRPAAKHAAPYPASHARSDHGITVGAPEAYIGTPDTDAYTSSARCSGGSSTSSLASGCVDSPYRAQRNVDATVTATSDIQSHRAAADSRNAIPAYATNISAITRISGRESTGQISAP